MGFSAIRLRPEKTEISRLLHGYGEHVLAEEYILIDISLSAASWRDFSSKHQWSLFSIGNSIYLSYRAEVTQNISTAQSPWRYLQA